MALVTLRIVDGVDRGRVYEDVPTPITVGREEGNVVRLSDERVSRFHLKIQEDRNLLVLTDLASTNGLGSMASRFRWRRFGQVI